MPVNVQVDEKNTEGDTLRMLFFPQTHDEIRMPHSVTPSLVSLIADRFTKATLENSLKCYDGLESASRTKHRRGCWGCWHLLTSFVWNFDLDLCLRHRLFLIKGEVCGQETFFRIDRWKLQKKIWPADGQTTCHLTPPCPLCHAPCCSTDTKLSGRSSAPSAFAFFPVYLPWFFLSCPLAVLKHTTGSSTKIAQVGSALELFAWLGTPQAVRKPPRATYSVHGCHLDSHENRTYRFKSQRCQLRLPSSSKWHKVIQKYCNDPDIVTLALFLQVTCSHSDIALCSTHSLWILHPLISWPLNFNHPGVAGFLVAWWPQRSTRSVFEFNKVMGCLGFWIHCCLHF